MEKPHRRSLSYRIARFALIVAWRFVSGRCLDGKYRTNATWRYGGTKVLHVSGHASRWCHLPRWKRSAARQAALWPAALTLYGLALHPEATVATLRVLVIASLPVVGFALYTAVRSWDHTRRYVIPIAHSVADRAGHSRDGNPHTWIDVPRGFRDDPDKKVTIKLGSAYSGGEGAQRTLGQHVAAKLGLVDADVSWDHVGAPTITVSARPGPPSMVLVQDCIEMLSKATSGRPLLGLGPRRSPVFVDLDAESPHVLMSASTGGGKSVLLRAILMQELHCGALALVLDVKRVSHAWARDLPNVAYARDIEAIHHALLWTAEEVDRRYSVIDEHANRNGDVDPLLIGPRTVLVVEEINALMERLKAYWSSIRESGDPTKSPAVQALHDVLFMGRQGLVNVLTAGQMPTAAALGGGAARENFATRIMARATTRAWAMLAPEIKPIPRSSKRAGRVEVVSAGDSTPCQVLNVAPAEAIEWATNGIASTFGALPSGHPLASWRPTAIATDSVSEPGVSPAHRPTLRLVQTNAGADEQQRPVGLRAAAESGFLASSLAMLKNERARDPEFPESVGRRGDKPSSEMLFDLDELVRWERNRSIRSTKA